MFFSVRRLFHFMNVQLSWFVRVSIHLLLFLFSCFGPFAKIFSYYRVLIVARTWIVVFWKLEAERDLFFCSFWSLQSAIFGGPPPLFIFLLPSFLGFLPFSLPLLNCFEFHRSVLVLQICLARSKWYLNSSFLLLMSSSSSWCSWWRFCMCALLLFFIFSNSSLISPLHVIFKNEIINHFRVPKTLTFKTGLSAKPFSWKWVLYARELKIIEFVTCWLR